MSNPIALFITDTHVDKNNQEHVFNIFEQVVQKAKEYGLNQIFHLGDFFNDRTGQGLSTLLFMRRVAKLLSDNLLEMVIIPGNHDKTDQFTIESYLHLFDKHDSIKLVEVPTRFTLGMGIELVLMPFFADEVYNKLLDGVIPTRKTILGTHIGINGVLNNNGIESEGVVETGKFSHFSLVLIGHYHNKQAVNKKIHYIGSTDPRNFGEDSNKGVTLLYSDLTIKLEKLRFREYLKVEINDLSHDNIKAKIAELRPVLVTTHIRFVLNGTEEDFIKVDENAIKQLGIDVKYKTESKTFIEEEEITDVSFSKVEIIKNFEDYCLENKVEKKVKLKALIYLQ